MYIQGALKWIILGKWFADRKCPTPLAPKVSQLSIIQNKTETMCEVDMYTSKGFFLNSEQCYFLLVFNILLKVMMKQIKNTTGTTFPIENQKYQH